MDVITSAVPATLKSPKSRLKDQKGRAVAFESIIERLREKNSHPDGIERFPAGSPAVLQNKAGARAHWTRDTNLLLHFFTA